MLLERFHLVKKSVDTIVEICDRFARNRIEEVANLIPTKTSELDNDSGFITSEDIPTIPTKTSELVNDSNFTTKQYVDGIASSIPTKTSQLQNDSGFTTFSGNYNDLTNKPTIPTKVSQLTNDSDFIRMIANSDIQSLSTAQISAGYSTSLGAYVIKFNFPDNSWFRLEMTTSNIILRNSGSGIIWSK